MLCRRSIIKLGLVSPFFSFNELSSKEKQNNSKNVIMLFLAGGMSHSDNFNIAPDAVDKYKSVSGFIKNKQGHIGGNWQNLSKIGDLYSLVHSFGHINSGHQGGTAYVIDGFNFTDENQGAKQTHPSPGSFLAKYFGTINNGIPTYVAVSRVFGLESSYLGNIYNPFSLDDQGKKDLMLNIPEERLILRKLMLNQVNKFAHVPSYVDSHKEQAFKLLTGNSRQIFEVDNEPQNIRELYGKTNIGNQLLLARRLIEKGSRFVTVVHGGWDMHQNIQKSLENLVPEVDKALSALLVDLKNKGLLDDTLVIVNTEFGRTPLNNGIVGAEQAAPGRDHYSRVTPLLLAGGGYGGTIIGKMDKNGFEVSENAYSPVDLLHTIMNHVGIQKSLTNTDFSGRPRYIIDGESKIIKNV